MFTSKQVLVRNPYFFVGDKRPETPEEKKKETKAEENKDDKENGINILCLIDRFHR